MTSERFTSIGETASLLTDVWCGRRTFVWRLENGAFAPEPPAPPRGILSGSFNPLHPGHCELCDAAARILDGPVHFELPIINAEKPPLEIPEIAMRLRQFKRDTVAVTTAATFVEKAVLFPGTAFVVGIDTAVRILDPKFYGGSDAAMYDALEAVASSECRFLVAGRSLDGRFQTLADLTIPGSVRALFDEVPESAFRQDVSSTDLRIAPDPPT